MKRVAPLFSPDVGKCGAVHLRAGDGQLGTMPLDWYRATLVRSFGKPTHRWSPIRKLTGVSEYAVIREPATAVSCSYSLKSDLINTGSSMHTP